MHGHTHGITSCVKLSAGGVVGVNSTFLCFYKEHYATSVARPVLVSAALEATPGS